MPYWFIATALKGKGSQTTIAAIKDGVQKAGKDS